MTAAHGRQIKISVIIMKIKKFLLSLMVSLSAFAVVFAGCGVYSDAVNPPGTNAGNGGNGGGGTGVVGGYTSAVEIYLETTNADGETVQERYTDTDGLQAQWRNSISVQTAEFNALGYASLSGLDGEYQVTITGLNEGVTGARATYYAYNTNIYSVNNDDPNAIIVIYEVTTPRGTSLDDGTGPYDTIGVNDVGIYRTQVTRQDQLVYFNFTPTRSGSFSLTSWLDATENLVDPVLYAFFGTSSFVNVNNPVIVDDGGTSGTFTSNFNYQVNFSDDMIGGSCIFAVTARSYTGEFPVDVYFALSYDSEYDRPTTAERVIVPEEQFKPAPEGEGTLRLVYEETGSEGGVRYAVLDDDLVGLNSEDGYYHMLDENGQPNGPLLYAYISSGSPIYGTAIINVEDTGNNSLTMYVGDDRRDYALMLQGYATAYQKWEAIVRSSYQNQPESVIQEVLNNRTPGDGSYLGYEDVEGYNDYVNSDGMYPVTPELKEFFQLFAESQLLFMDGDGWVEGSIFNGYHYDAYDDSMWLFCCAYYA